MYDFDPLHEAGLDQVEASDDETAYFNPSPRLNCISGGGNRGLLSRAMDPLDDHLLRSYVPPLLVPHVLRAHRAS